jgi:hypothetical protein
MIPEGRTIRGFMSKQPNKQIFKNSFRLRFIQANRKRLHNLAKSFEAAKFIIIV